MAKAVKEVLKYHGVQPPTKRDAKIGLKHLNWTEDLNDKKIDDHETAYDRAKKENNEPSAHYHSSHLKKHKKDNKEIKQSKKTIAQILRSK